MRHHLAEIVIRAASWLAPRHERARWREEWLGEIASQKAEGKKQKILRAAIGAPRDALTLRAATARETLRTMAAGWRTDIRQTLRTLWHAPGHVATVVLCLGIGTSISVAVFSAFNAVVFGELAGLADRRSLVRLLLQYDARLGEGIDRGRPVTGNAWSASDYEVLDASKATELAGLAVEASWPLAVTLDREPVAATAAFVSGDYFGVLGTQPIMGRLLRPEDHRVGAPLVAVIGYHLWRDRLGGTPDIVGRPVLVGDRICTIVGVTPPRFTGANPADIDESPLTSPQLWLPLHRAADWPGVPGRDVPWHRVYGRLRAGATLETARAAMTFGASRLAEAYPDTRRGATIVVRDLGYGPDDDPVEILAMISAALSLPLLVLFIGCANVASLQLARATDRARELSVRLALGASRAQLVRLLTAECAVLGTLAVAAGTLGAQVLLTIAQPTFPVALTLDRRVLLFAVALIVGVTVLSGLAPAWWNSRRAESLSLKASGRPGSLAHSRVRHALVIVQMALALALLVTTGFFLASLRAMRGEVPPAARSTLVVLLDVDTLGYPGPEARRIRDDILARLSSHPGVESAAAERLATVRYWSAADSIDTTRLAGGGYVSASWFDTAGARLIAGRFFDASDSGATAVISERMARELAPDGSVLGSLVYINNLGNTVIAFEPGHRQVLSRPSAGPKPPASDVRAAVQIVGVVADIPRRPGDLQPGPMIYLPFPAEAPGAFRLRVRAKDPASMAQQIRDVIRQTDRRFAPAEIQSAETLFLRDSDPVRLVAWSIGGLGLIALCLAAAGLYAVMAYLVALRRQEIGIRLALGARPGDVLRLILGQGFRLAVAGSLAGFAIAMPVALTLRASFVGMSPFDPAAMFPPAAVLMVVTLLASAVPARRASRIDPIRALRED